MKQADNPTKKFGSRLQRLEREMIAQKFQLQKIEANDCSKELFCEMQKLRKESKDVKEAMENAIKERKQD